MLRRSFVSKDRSASTLPTNSSKRSSQASTKRSSRSSHITKASSRSSLSFRNDDAKIQLIEQFATASNPPLAVASTDLCSPALSSPGLNSDIVTIAVGKGEIGKGSKLFAVHVDNLVCTQFFLDKFEPIRDLNPQTRRMYLPDEQPDVFTAVLEYLYRGDYFPCMLRPENGRKSWCLEDVQASPTSPNFVPNRGNAESVTVHLDGVGRILRDTAVYCAAERFGLADLKRLALRKQGMQYGVEVSTILRSARYAYEHTPDDDVRLRSHFLTLIIRSRGTFARSGTMQMEMQDGGRMFFDLFVATCNQIDAMQQKMDAMSEALTQLQALSAHQQSSSRLI